MHAGHFWDMPDADEEAGQDKLRSAVEWGIFHRFPRSNGGPSALLNLKPSLRNAYFERIGASPTITVCPDGGNIAAWIASLPAGAFDEIFALDFFQMHSDTEHGMAELARVLKKGGTVFLNFFSSEHFKQADKLPGPNGAPSLGSVSAIPPVTLAPDQAVALARRHGLIARKIIPYSSFYGNSLWVGMLKNRFRWERILDWLSTNRKLFDLALHLEESIVARLGSISAPKYMLVVQLDTGHGARSPDLSGCDDGWNAEASYFNVAAAADRAGLSPDRIREGLGPYLSDFRNRVFFHHLWDLLRRNFGDSGRGEWLGILPEAVRKEFQKWHGYEQVDELCLQTVRDWHRIPSISLALRHRRIPLGPGLEYGQFPAMLTRLLGASGKGGNG